MTLSKTEATVIEGSTPTYNALIEKGVILGTQVTHKPLLLEEIASLTLDYVNDSDSTTINARSAQDVLNANDVIVKTRGELFWKMQIADTAIVSTTLESGELESHTATFKVVTVTDSVIYKMVNIWVKKR